MVVAQQIEQTRPPALGFGGDQHAVRRARQVPLQRRQRLAGAAIHAEVGQRAAPVHRLVAAQRQRGMGLCSREELVDLQEHVFGRQQRALLVVLQEAVALARVGPEALQGLVDLTVQHECRAAAEVVEDRCGVLEEERQVVLDAAAGDAQLDVLVGARLARVAFDLLAPARTESGARGFVQRELPPGQQAHLGHRVQAALRVGVEGADRIYLVAEQVDAVGHRRAHGEEVDQPAAHRVLARRDHLADVLVAGQRELRLQLRFVELRLLPEVKGVAGQERRWRQPRQRGGSRHQHHVHLALKDAPKRGQTLRDQVLVRAEGVVGQRLPIREQRQAQARREEWQFVEQALRVGGLGGDDGQRPLARRSRCGQPREQQRVAGTDRARHREALALGQAG